MSVVVPLVKLIHLLSPAEFEQELPKVHSVVGHLVGHKVCTGVQVLMTVVGALRDRLQATRDAARDALVKVCGALCCRWRVVLDTRSLQVLRFLGGGFLAHVVRELRSGLTEGYQIHVLGAHSRFRAWLVVDYEHHAGHTVHSVLEAVKDDILPPVLLEIDLTATTAAASAGAVDALVAERGSLSALTGGAASLASCLDDIIEVIVEDTLGCGNVQLAFAVSGLTSQQICGRTARRRYRVPPEDGTERSQVL